MKWNVGVEFQIVALQATVADVLQGDTIHHALGIAIFGHEHVDTRSNQDMTIANSMLQWRWLMIHEISMVSGKLLAQVDMKLRHYARSVDPYAIDGNAATRPFGGLNVICSGDFWQLLPPDGGFLGDVPCEYIQASRKDVPNASIAHGQSLMWSGKDTGIQGVTELHQCERDKEEWLRSVQEEFRVGMFTDETHAFLHDKPTMQPGLFLKGTLRS